MHAMCCLNMIISLVLLAHGYYLIKFTLLVSCISVQDVFIVNVHMSVELLNKGINNKKTTTISFLNLILIDTFEHWIFIIEFLNQVTCCYVCNMCMRVLACMYVCMCVTLKGCWAICCFLQWDGRALGHSRGLRPGTEGHGCWD